jgi:hypothetical protein
MWGVANRLAPALVLRDGDRERLTSLSRSPSVRADLVLRAKIVLLAADGVANVGIASRLGCARQTVLDWRARYEAGGVEGLNDEPRPGRARTVDRAAIIAATLSPPPKKLGVTHWSSRLLAAHLDMAQTAIVRAWRDYGVAPWRTGTFKFSTDPQLVGKVVDVVGLYLAPPENAVVLCVDELCDDSQNSSMQTTTAFSGGLR